MKPIARVRDETIAPHVLPTNVLWSAFLADEVSRTHSPPTMRSKR